MQKLYLVISFYKKTIIKILQISCLSLLFYGCQKPIKSIPEIKVKEYNIYCEHTDLTRMFENYKKNNYIPITIEKTHHKRNAAMRIRGDSSRDYDKKSLKVKITDSLSIDTKWIFNFNAEYSDASFVRSFLSSKIFKKLNYPCFSASFANININNKYHGLFVEIENMDRDFLKKNGLNPKGDLFKATKDGACLYAISELEEKWEKKTNKKSSKINLEQLIQGIAETNSTDFYHYVKQHFNYPMLIKFLAINAFIANGSTYYHNYYLYRDHENNGKWILLPWDLDKTISYYDWKPYKYNFTSSDWENDNPLIEKCFLNQQIFNDFKQQLKFIGAVINPDFYDPILQGITESLKESVLRDSTNKIYSETKWLKKIEQEKFFLQDSLGNNRSDQLLANIEAIPMSFEVYQTPSELSVPFKICWEKSNNADNYELWISQNFLYPDSVTYKFKTDSNFYLIKDSLPVGKYYWKVRAKNEHSYTDGFNSKNSFNLKQGTILSNVMNSDVQLIKEQSPYRVIEDITIDASSKLSIEPGVTILMDENTEISCKGSFYAIGDQHDPINILPISSNSYFNSIYFLNSENAHLKHVHIKDGVINSKYSNLNISNSEIIINSRPMQIGDKRPSIIWGWHGNVELNNIYLMGNGQGEGINISYAKSKITNSEFYYTPDAIELINVEEGIIANNIVMFSPDDAIDLNDCSNINIYNNTLLNNADKGISIGTDWNNKFVASKPGFNRKSLNIQINNNYIMGNNIGMSIKDSSKVKANDNIISFNKLGVQLYKKYEKYMLGGVLHADQNVINQNKTDFSVDSFSRIVGPNAIDSIYIIPTENYFIIPSSIDYTISDQTIILKNKSNIYCELANLVLIDENNNEIFKFYKNHNIAPQKTLTIGTKKDTQSQNYFYASKLNFANTKTLYLKDRNRKITLLKND